MTENTELKATIEAMGRAFEEFKTENDRLIRQGVKDALAEAKLEKLSATIDDLAAKKDAIDAQIKAERDAREALERKVNDAELNGRGTDEVEAKQVAEFDMSVKSLARERGLSQPTDMSVADFRAYKSAFVRALRRDVKHLSADEVKAMQVGVDADGGYLVPADTAGRIVQRVFELSPIRSIAAVQSISSDRLEGMVDRDEADSGWVGETATRSDTGTPQVGKYEIPAFEMYAQPKATQKLLDDASVNIEAWLAAKVADKFARVEGAAFISGNGVTQPRGFASYTTAATADASRAWGVLEHVITGANGAFKASNANPADCLFDLEQALNPAYRGGARWVTNRAALLAVRKLKDAQYQYLWQPGLQAGQPSSLIGYPITMAEDMPALGTGSLSMAFGNFAEGYQIVDRLGVRTIRDPYTDKPYVKFYTIRRVGGAVVNFDAIKLLNFTS